jgi:hypothetical protein
MAKNNYVEVNKKVHTLKATGIYINDEGEKCIDVPEHGVVKFEDLLKNFDIGDNICIQITKKDEEPIIDEE